jgi:hypothetical protein
MIFGTRQRSVNSRESDCRHVGDCIHPVIESRHNGGMHGPVARVSGGVAGGIEEET